MRLGVFTHYFPHPAAEAAARIRRLGLDCVQLNTAFPDWQLGAATTAADCTRIRRIFADHELAVAAVAGYRNIVAPDAGRRRANLDHLKLLLDRTNDCGSPFVATESGSRHPTDDWAPCPENDTTATMRMLTDVVGELAGHAARAGAVLLIEPSVGTVLDRPGKIAALAATLDSPALGFVADWPNLIDGTTIDDPSAVLAEMAAPLAGRVRLAHVKDACRFDGTPRENHHHPTDPALYGGVEYPAPGLGSLDLAAYVKWLDAIGYDGPLIIEHVAEQGVAAAIDAVRAAGGNER